MTEWNTATAILLVIAFAAGVTGMIYTVILSIAFHAIERRLDNIDRTLDALYKIHVPW